MCMTFWCCRGVVLSLWWGWPGHGSAACCWVWETELRDVTRQHSWPAVQRDWSVQPGLPAHRWLGGPIVACDFRQTTFGRGLESDRISFSFSVRKMLIFDGFGHFRFRPKMMLRFRFRFRFWWKRRTKTPKFTRPIFKRRSLSSSKLELFAGYSLQ